LKIDSLSALKNDLNKSVTSTSAQDSNTVNVFQRNVNDDIYSESLYFESLEQTIELPVQQLSEASSLALALENDLLIIETENLHDKHGKLFYILYHKFCYIFFF